MSVFRRRLMSASRKGSGIDMSNYMTIEALEDGLTAKLTRTTCEYSINGGEWVSLAANTSTPAINAGQIISFKANDPTAASNNGIGTFTITKKCNLKGNCMSMLAYDDAANMATVKLHGFRTLFKDCTNIINVEKGFLPATTLNNYCYYDMFRGCYNLTTAPDLPATSLKSYCYRNMFYDCVSLTQSPELPATTLANHCYYGMFDGCSKLETPPALPATKLQNYCYRDMFYDCSSLKTAPELPATTLTTYCYAGMFRNCTSLTSAPELPAIYLNSYCYYQMFYNCGKLENAPYLGATFLDTMCYGGMFYGCTRLYEFQDELPATILADSCYYEMFRSSGIERPPKLPAIELANSCYAYMFSNCYFNSNTQIVLPATELYPSCYGGMFQSCNLGAYSSVKVYAATNFDQNGTSAVLNFLNNSYGVYSVFCSDIYKGLSDDETLLKDTFRTDFSVPNDIAIEIISGSISGIIINLNGQWAKNDSISPNTSLYDAYESVSNVGVDSSEAIMYITINGLSSFRLYLRSYAESSYDYAMVSQLNASIDGDTSTSSSDVKVHTKGNQQSGTSLSSYLIANYDNIPSGDNVITVVYRKDGSQSSGTDKAYVLIPK